MINVAPYSFNQWNIETKELVDFQLQFYQQDNYNPIYQWMNMRAQRTLTRQLHAPFIVTLIMILRKYAVRVHSSTHVRSVINRIITVQAVDYIIWLKQFWSIRGIKHDFTVVLENTTHSLSCTSFGWRLVLRRITNFIIWLNYRHLLTLSHHKYTRNMRIQPPTDAHRFWRTTRFNGNPPDCHVLFLNLHTVAV